MFCQFWILGLRNLGLRCSPNAGNCCNLQFSVFQFSNFVYNFRFSNYRCHRFCQFEYDFLAVLLLFGIRFQSHFQYGFINFGIRFHRFEGFRTSQFSCKFPTKFYDTIFIAQFQKCFFTNFRHRFDIQQVLYAVVSPILEKLFQITIFAQNFTELNNVNTTIFQKFCNRESHAFYWEFCAILKYHFFSAIFEFTLFTQPFQWCHTSVRISLSKPAMLHTARM